MPRPQLSGFRIRAGEKLRLNFISSQVQVYDALARVVYDDGTDDQFAIPQTSSLGDRSLEVAESREVAAADGTVTNAYVGIVTSGTKRGTFFAQLGLGPTLTTILCRGYVYTMRNLNLGEFGEPGPGGGEGFLSWVSLAVNATPPVDVTRVLAAANALRVIRGFAWYVNAAAVVATRTMEVRLERAGLAVPTGFTGRGLIWSSGTISLTTGEEGLIWAGEKTSVLNDNGAATASNTASAAVPFPYLAEENDLAELVFDIGAADAADVGSLYLLQEEWLVF